MWWFLLASTGLLFIVQLLDDGPLGCRVCGAPICPGCGHCHECMERNMVSWRSH
jgi:hypothetical protein